ncbi:MAG: hypothetical protein N2170_07620 [Bacteroidia bacterium]|nr:hypothetical protein [Bacteroidia bacterium]
MSKRKLSVPRGRTAASLSDTEKQALKDTLQERKKQILWAKDPQAGRQAVETLISAMPEADQKLAQAFHQLVLSIAPTLLPRPWYGMPAYANSAGQVVCFFQPAHKFKTRYATIGFTDKAYLDQDSLWPVSFAVIDLGEKEIEHIARLLRNVMERKS